MVEVEALVSHGGAGAPTRWLHGRTWLHAQSSPEKLELALQGSIFDHFLLRGRSGVGSSPGWVSQQVVAV
jgi:hypothetical protein